MDPSCLYIHPVKLDGADVDFAFCTRCHSFMPKSHGFVVAKVRVGAGPATYKESPGIHRCHLKASRLREVEGGAQMPQSKLHK